ncbi:MAG: ABC transporter ATP-binding protein [Pseudomonadales bacterium]|nr:ABC transporter ATP-binding protein [Halioglobus sp.]MCP5121633.1 ABC transporter ATP-binding protein [Pseudomonadales bacterium]MCP5194322.1 ABC transporter ATP-binding protein [Pseudomonadales bacterium]
MSDIRCRNLCKTFHQGGETITALDQVSLDIGEGAFVCLSGPSGSGKTTLLNALGGLDTPDSGTIAIGEQRLEHLSRRQRADLRLHHIGFVFQAYNLITVLSARENVEFIMQVQGVPAKEREKLATGVLAEVGLAGLEERRPAELSGGQQQRVAVARAIATRPALVLADEPTANLDSRSAARLMDLFVTLNRERGVTFVISTHDARVMGYARRLIGMRDGRIVSDQEQQPHAMAI